MPIPHEDQSVAPNIQRVVWWSLAVACSAALIVAAFVEPDVRGFGTHTQLGLPPCGFLELTGTPCPGCGLTTAFAHAIRGRFVQAADANAFGLLLFAIVCASIPLGLMAGWRRWSVDAVLERFALSRWALALAGCGVLLWVVRLTKAF